MHYGQVALDICYPCQGIWFDQFESVQITPGGVIDLFHRIEAQGDTARNTIPQRLHCPRCSDRLSHGLDIARAGGRFNYFRCLQNHGRFTVFSQFMIEKGFVRQLAPAEVKALAARIGTVHCTGCGAPVDIRHESACRHCKAPISILDPSAVEKTMAEFEHKEFIMNQRDPEALADALLDAERKRRPLRSAAANDPVGDLLLSGINLALDFFKR